MGGTAQNTQPPATRDLRPKEEYDDPWEWSTTHSIIFKEGEEVLPAHCVKAFPDQSFRNKVSDCVAAADKQQQQQPQQQQAPVNNAGKTVTSKHDRHDYVNTNIQPPSGREADGRSCSEEGDINKTRAGGEVASSSAAEKGAVGGARPKESTQGATCPTKRLGNYEEPWDLSFTRGKLEECFKAKISTSDDGATAQEEEKPPPQAAAGGAQAQPAPDTRPQEGYEKPWDWKPDRKVSFLLGFLVG